MSNVKKNAKKSVKSAIIFFVVNTLIKFAVRTIIIHLLGSEILGLDTLYTNIITVLSISELGISQAMNFTLYEPIAKKQWGKLHALSDLYKKIYLIIGLAIIVLGLAIIPFLPALLKDGVDIPFVYLIYCLYLANAAIPYLLRGKRPVLAADTRQYIQANNDSVFSVISGILQVSVLLLWPNLLGYALTLVALTTLSNIRMYKIAGKLYNHIDSYIPKKLDSATKTTIKTTVLGTAFVKLKRLIVMNTDTILVSLLFNLSVVGKYGNYLIIINLLRGLITTATAPLISALAHISIERSQNQIRKIFMKYNMAIGIIALIVFAGFAVCVNPFIEIWAGTEYVMPLNTVLWFGFALFLNIVYHGSETFMESFGLQRHHKIISVIEVVLNIILSIFFAVVLDAGVTGIIAGTCVSMLLTSFWYTPYIVWKHILREKKRLS